MSAQTLLYLLYLTGLDVVLNREAVPNIITYTLRVTERDSGIVHAVVAIYHIEYKTGWWQIITNELQITPYIGLADADIIAIINWLDVEVS